ncbi:MAG TPA: protein kinase [Candidatus Melainabacteria bacterium]|nr:protein kinase [Candidatus Melainabacteria bacterium]
MSQQDEEQFEGLRSRLKVQSSRFDLTRRNGPAGVKVDDDVVLKYADLPRSNAKGNFYFEKHQLIQYSPNYEIIHFFREAEKRIAAIIASLVIFCLVAGSQGWIDPIVKWLSHTFLTPLKPILVGTGVGAMPLTSGLVDMIGLFSTIAFILLGIVIAGLVIYSHMKPTHIALTRYNIHMLRKVFGPSENEFSITNDLSWDSIERARVEKPTNRQGLKDYVLILETRKRASLNIRLGYIFVPEERNYFLNLISAKLGPQRFAKEDLELIKPLDEGVSYTELWLKELSAPPKRDKLRPLEPGVILHNGKYRVIGKIGIGGQGTVYYAHAGLSETVSEEVVLKEFVLPIYPDPRVRKQSAERFQEEASLLSRLDHIQVVDFKEIFIEDHRLYMVMEKVEGMTLEELVQSYGPQPTQYVIDLMRSMAQILLYLHNLNPPVIHRDFTPDNLILEPDGAVKLIDFSVAMEIKNDFTGSVVGKMNYIAPEQFQGKACTMSDIYSLGATAYYLLTGNLPEAISTSDPKSPDAELNEIVKRCTRTDVEARYSRIEEVLADLKLIEEKANQGENRIN